MQLNFIMEFKETTNSDNGKMNTAPIRHNFQVPDRSGNFLQFYYFLIPHLQKLIAYSKTQVIKHLEK